MKQHFVDIVVLATQKQVKTFGPYDTEREAMKVVGGAEINLDHANYFVQMRTESDDLERDVREALA